MKIIVVFNKFTDEYIGITYATDAMKLNEDACCDVHFKYKTLDMDPEVEVWQGNFADGAVVPLGQQKTVITETELDADCQDKIFREYRYYHQLNVVYGALDKIIEASTIDESLLSEYRSMRQYIDSIVSNNERYKLAYAAQDGYEYRDKAKEREVLNAQLEGGLHEVLGREAHPGTPQ